MRPLAFGYVTLPGSIRAGSAELEVAAAGRALARFAAGEGYALAGIFTDWRGRTENGLYAMLGALSQGQAVAVLVPSLDDLWHCGCLAGATVQTAARYLQARLMTMDGPVERSRRDRRLAGPTIVTEWTPTRRPTERLSRQDQEDAKGRIQAFGEYPPALRNGPPLGPGAATPFPPDAG